MCTKPHNEPVFLFAISYPSAETDMVVTVSPSRKSIPLQLWGRFEEAHLMLGMSHGAISLDWWNYEIK